jgi:hypothetical protein
MKIRGQVDLESCQTNKGIQLNEKWWLGLTIIRSFFQPQLPLYIGGEAEGFMCRTSTDYHVVISLSLY